MILFQAKSSHLLWYRWELTLFTADFRKTYDTAFPGFPGGGFELFAGCQEGASEMKKGGILLNPSPKTFITIF
jgi:hypothetical protein